MTVLRNFGPEIAKDKPRNERLKELREKIAKLDAELPPLTHAMAVAVGYNGAQDLHSRSAAITASKGEEVQPGTCRGTDARAAGEGPAGAGALADWTARIR